MASAQEVYLGLSPTAEAPKASGWEFLTDGLTGKWTERNRQYQEAVNEFNAQKLLQAAEWEREDTSYQRLVNDLKKAGINPYYALNQGSISLSSSNGSDIYSTKGKSSAKSKDDINIGGLIALAALMIKLIA